MLSEKAHVQFEIHTTQDFHNDISSYKSRGIYINGIVYLTLLFDKIETNYFKMKTDMVADFHVVWSISGTQSLFISSLLHGAAKLEPLSNYLQIF